MTTLTAEDLMEKLEEIISAAGSEPLAEEAQAEVAELENKLAVLHGSEAIKARQNARKQVAPGIRPVDMTGASSTELKALDRYLRSGDPSMIKNALSEGVPSEGGYLVPDEFREKIVECMHSFGGMMQHAEEITTSTGASMSWPTISDAPADVPNEAVITPEGTQQASGGADPVFGEASIGSYTYTTTGASNEPVRISRELLQDARIDVQAKISSLFGIRIARKLARDIATGSGVGEPKGILNGTADVELVTANDLANAANGYAKLLEIEDSVDTAYLANAKWVMNRTVWTQVRKIVDADGRPLIQANSTAGIGGGIARTLLGYEVVIDEGFPNPADDVNFMVFGDIREAYLVRHVADLEVLVDPYSRGKYRQVEMSGWARADGTVQNRCAYSIVKGKDA